LVARITRPAASPTATVSAVTRLTLPGTHIKRGETLVNLAIIGCVLTTYFARITDETIPILVSSIAVIAGLIANWVIHDRQKKPGRPGMDLKLGSDRLIQPAGESDHSVGNATPML